MNTTPRYPNPLSGTYMNNTGAAVCFDCPERYYCDGTTPSGYTECPVGHYCPEGTGASIPNCPSGETVILFEVGLVPEYRLSFVEIG